MSITQQKSDLREIIHRRIADYIGINPEEASNIAMGAIRRLSAKMTLKELQKWNTALSIRQHLGEAEQ